MAIKEILDKIRVFIHSSIKTRIETSSSSFFFNTSALFLYIVPLKQGLKRFGLVVLGLDTTVFIHSSIKTRIETPRHGLISYHPPGFLYIVPLKQGLKPNFSSRVGASGTRFYT